MASASPLIVGLLVFISSILSLKLGLPVAIFEIIFGVVAGNLGLEAEEWMIYFASFGGIVLVFLAGAETDTSLVRQKFKETLILGFFSFATPFLGASLFAYFVAGWSLLASLVAGTALSETSVAIVYSVVVEANKSKTQTGKMLMAATFVTNMGTALVLSILFTDITLRTLILLVSSIAIIALSTKLSYFVFSNQKLKNKIVEPEIKWIFLVLLIFLYLASLGIGHAILPAFIFGILMARYFSDQSEAKVVKNRLRTVAFAVITPIFFIFIGMQVSLKLVLSAFGLFIAFFVVKQLAKFFGVYFLAKKYIPYDSTYFTLLLSTGLTFGLIAAIFGLQASIIDRVQYSILIGVLITSAVLPTFVAQKWYLPVHSEDIIEENRVET